MTVGHHCGHRRRWQIHQYCCARSRGGPVVRRRRAGCPSDQSSARGRPALSTRTSCGIPVRVRPRDPEGLVWPPISHQRRTICASCRSPAQRLARSRKRRERCRCRLHLSCQEHPAGLSSRRAKPAGVASRSNSRRPATPTGQPRTLLLVPSGFACASVFHGGELQRVRPQPAIELVRCRVRTARTRLVMRVVEQRILRRSRQVFRAAMACSTRARIFAWDRFAACWPAESVSHRPQCGIRIVPMRRRGSPCPPSRRSAPGRERR